jgi:hypothetical protein
MRETILYLQDTDVERLRRLSDCEGRSQAEILSSALAAYEASRSSRVFALAGAWEGDGTSIADITEEDLLRGFECDAHLGG